MANLDLESTFPAFTDVQTEQFYDTPMDAETALQSFKARHVGALDPSAISDLLTDLKEAVILLVRQIMPEEETTTRIDYTVDNMSGMRVSAEHQLARLQMAKDEQEVAFRVANVTLEQTFQALLDHLTSARVAEEMDAPTYVERLRGGFKRVREGAASLKVSLQDQSNVARRIHGRISVARELSSFLENEIIPQLVAAAPEHAALEQQASALTLFCTKSEAFADHFCRFLAQSIQSLRGIEKELCSDASIAGAEGESILVSRELERHALFRPLPILWAWFIVFLVKIVLAHNTLVTLHALSIPILILAFVMTWGLSILIGIGMRTRRMRDLQRHIRSQFRLLMRDSRTKDALIEFPAVKAAGTVRDQPSITAYAYRGKVILQKWRVAMRNLWALAIPVVLLAVVWSSREDTDHQFVAQFDGAQPCVLVSGRLVFATRASYFVIPADAPSGYWPIALARIVPELFADVIAREAVIAMTEESPDLRACVTPDADQGRYTLVHEGGALGILGDTDVTVFAQGGGGGGGPQLVITNPIIIDARTVIETELSKEDPSEIRIESVLNALNVIRTEIGGDLTLSQTLRVAFSDPSILRPGFEFPDSMLSLFEGDTTIMSELSALRAAFERSNDLAETFITTFENGTDFDSRVAILGDQLGLLIENHDQLVSVIAQGLTANIQGGPVVTPIIFDPSITGPGAQSVLNANLFQTSISLSGESVGTETIANTLVLPFFPTPVRTGTGDLATPEGAFAWGSDEQRLIDPEVLPDGTTYFARIAQTLESCLVQDATVTIDLLGLASRSWEGRTVGFSNAELNYHLAEGRRIGALRKIAGFFEDREAHDRILVQRDQGGAMQLSDIITAFETNSDIRQTLPRFGRYDGPADFEMRRDTLLAVTGLNPDVVSPLEELFGRSVVLRMVSTDGGPCKF